MVPSVLRSLIMQACHGLPAFGGHLAFIATFGRVRDRYWWPTMLGDIQSYCSSLVVMPANVGKLHTVDHRFQQVMYQ